MTTEFTISRANCFFGWSRPLETLSAGESFTIRFKPLSVDYMEGSEWANSVEFWLDRLPAEGDDAIGLVFVWVPDSRWYIDFLTPESSSRRSVPGFPARRLPPGKSRESGLAEQVVDRQDHRGAALGRVLALGLEGCLRAPGDCG